jgi:hypothetical protein
LKIQLKIREKAQCGLLQRISKFNFTFTNGGWWYLSVLENVPASFLQFSTKWVINSKEKLKAR